MRKILVIATLFFGVLTAQAQETVMTVQKTDGTSEQTRVAELKQISFLTVEEGGQGLRVKTTGGETTKVLFEANPVVTISKGKLVVKSDAADAVEFEIADVAEITFGEATGVHAVGVPQDFSCVLQDGGVLLRGIPLGVQPQVYTLDGRSLPVPPLQGSELLLTRSALGKGVYVVKVGKVSTKIKL